ncbi:hypothetical protein [Jannaschia aquimarina]|uniref:Uncharacterized protein n=1 Tax=Jannaschia aquimarina TaxID=935700 RepID=A0A0D1EH20_9RHOB|nr:hypothetical protein [Jannaschia aquimarina]KIT16186.1 hypothetical protein jaqu_20770 [Jannaschia aquimarina]SNT43954.1 hypothetical protein SAMN05421775_1251 [Jannaschia aquimarina]
MQVMLGNRSHRKDPSRSGWRPDQEVHPGEHYVGPGRPDPSPGDGAYPEEVPGSRRLEEWLHDRGIVVADDAPDDMSQYHSIVSGPEPTLRASLAAIRFDEDWIGDTALRHVLYVGAHYSQQVGADRGLFLARLPVGWGTHKLPPHFNSLIAAMEAEGFCERTSDYEFTWSEAIAPFGEAVLPMLWRDGPDLWEQRKWELRHIWHTMPKSIKAKHIRHDKPLNVTALDMDLTAFYDRSSRRWSEAPIASRSQMVLARGHLADELDRLDREEGLSGRRRRAETRG